MVCTFGDLTDVMWWRELGLPVRSVLGPDGRLLEVPWGAPGWESEDLDARARELRASCRAARSTRRADGSSSCSRQSGDLRRRAASRSTRAVKFFEKGERPVEIVTSRQWFIRTIEHREELIARGRELHWHPPYMRARFEDWVNGPDRRLVRQPPALLRRAVPAVVPARRATATFSTSSRSPRPRTQLPVDPSTDVPDGYDERPARAARAASRATPT